MLYSEVAKNSVKVNKRHLMGFTAAVQEIEAELCGVSWQHYVVMNTKSFITKVYLLLFVTVWVEKGYWDIKSPGL